MTRAVKVQECASLGLKVVQLFAELLEDLSALFGLIDWLSQDFPFIWLLKAISNLVNLALTIHL